MVPMGYIHEEYRGSHQDRSPTDFHKRRAPCRYYLTGHCKRGPSCPFSHVSAAAQVETLTIAHPTYSADHLYPYFPLGQTPTVYSPLTSQAYPAFLWQPYPSLSPSFDPRYGPVHRAETALDYPDDKSDPSSAESSSTGASVDNQLHMAPDTARSECPESGTVRGVARPAGDVRITSSPGYAGYGFPFFSGVKLETLARRDRATSVQYRDHGAMGACPVPPLLPCQDDVKKKPLAYKTKPCKFYTTSGRCTSGEKCTFIHDPESRAKVDKPPKALSLPFDAKLPPKPLSKYDDCRARDFYPITWRVIGGGVMMGGQRNLCPAFLAGHCKYGNDCKLAHETELETDRVGFIELKSEESRQHGKGTDSKRGRSGSQRRKATPPENVTPPPVKFSSTTSHSRGPDKTDGPSPEGTGKKDDDSDGALPSARDAPSSPVHRRTRSMSVVVTSPPPVETLHPNYAAEL